MSKKNNLMEAAADVLSRSQSSAPSDPPKKLEGSEALEIGGPTPTDEKKQSVDATKGTPTASAPGPKAPVGQEPMHKLEGDGSRFAEEKEDDDEEEKEEKDDKDEKEMNEAWQQQLKEDVDAILASESNLSEEFRSKIATIYEARVIDKVNAIVEQIEADYEEQLEESIVSLRDQLSEKIDQYLDYVVENWMKENEVAIETGLRAELCEDFIAGMKNLFAEHYIDVPAEKVDVVEELAGKVADLETQLNEEVQRNIELKKQINESKKNEILQSVCEGLTQTQMEKVRTLAESVEFTAEGEYKSKLETIRENFYPSNTKPADAQKVLTETLEQEQPEKKQTAISPEIAHYVAALGRTLPN